MGANRIQHVWPVAGTENEELDAVDRARLLSAKHYATALRKANAAKRPVARNSKSFRKWHAADRAAHSGAPS
jgi:hypothetical protein